MSEAQRDGLHFTKTEAEYLRIALQRLTDDYVSQNASERSISITRALIDRLAGYTTGRTGLPQERAQKWQAALMQALQQRDEEGSRQALRGWWEDIYRYEIDPPAVMSQLMDKLMKAASQNTALTVIDMVGRKWALITRRLLGEDLVNTFGQWLATGEDSVRKGEELWPDLVDEKLPESPPIN